MYIVSIRMFQSQLGTNYKKGVLLKSKCLMVSSLCSFCVPGSSTLSPASKATFRHRTPVGLGCGALDSGCSLLSHWSAFSPTASTSTSSSSFSTFRHLVRLLVLIATKRFQILLVLKEFFLYRTWSRTNANFRGNCLLISFVSATRNPVTDRKHSYVNQEIPVADVLYIKKFHCWCT